MKETPEEKPSSGDFSVPEKVFSPKQDSSSSFELSPADVESISSGRASETDTDADSDYSSHEDEGFFFSAANMNHGDYDPDYALEKVYTLTKICYKNLKKKNRFNF